MKFMETKFFEKLFKKKKQFGKTNNNIIIFLFIYCVKNIYYFINNKSC